MLVEVFVLGEGGKGGCFQVDKKKGKVWVLEMCLIRFHVVWKVSCIDCFLHRRIDCMPSLRCEMAGEPNRRRVVDQRGEKLE